MKAIQELSNCHTLHVIVKIPLSFKYNFIGNFPMLLLMSLQITKYRTRHVISHADFMYLSSAVCIFPPCARRIPPRVSLM